MTAIKRNSIAGVVLAALGSTASPAYAIVAPDYRDTLDRSVALQDEIDPELRVNRFDPYLADDYSYDSNLFRLPSTVTNLSSLPGIGHNPSRSDSLDTATAGLDARWFVGNRQDIDVDLRADDNRYFRNKDLSNFSTSDRLAWNWGLGSVLSGQVGADYTRFLAGFANTETYARNMIERTEYFAGGRYQVGPRWALFAGILDQRYRFTADPSAFNNSQSKAVELGADLFTSAANSLGVDYRYTDSRYPNSISLAGVAFNPDYREDRYRVFTHYVLTDKTLIDANVGYLTRRYPVEAIGGYSGEVGRVTLQWQPLPKTQLLVSAWQDLNADLTAQTDYFRSRGVIVTPAWTPTEKIGVGVSASRDTRAYLGSNPIGSNLLIIVPESQNRHDTLTTETANLTYAPTQIVGLAFTVGHEVRASNYRQFQYNDFRGDANITVRF